MTARAHKEMCRIIGSLHDVWSSSFLIDAARIGPLDKEDAKILSSPTCI
jgi:hypothetical protein